MDRCGSSRSPAPLSQNSVRHCELGNLFQARQMPVPDRQDPHRLKPHSARATHARLMSASLTVCGRMLVSVSVAPGVEPNLTVPASELESLTKAVPSTRQNTSASSFSTRLHSGQRFIFGVPRPVAAFIVAIARRFWSVPGTRLIYSSTRCRVAVTI